MNNWQKGSEESILIASGGTKLFYSESSLSLFFNKKILQRCLRREWGEWVGTFVIEMIAEPNFWTIPFLKKNEKKSVNFNLSNHWTKGLPTVKTFVFFYKVYKILVVVVGSFPFEKKYVANSL